MKNILAIILLVLTFGCQASDEGVCADDPQSSDCLDATDEGDASDSTITEPSDASDTAEPEPEPEPEPEENPDPLSTEAPEYHSIEELLSHLSALDQIAIANNNNRAAGTSGYEASVDYVKSQLESWGYEVTLQGFTIDVYDIGDDPILELSDQNNTWSYQQDFGIIHYSAAGDITGPFIAVDVEVPPEGGANSTNSGCQTNDFLDFPQGAIALIQRGSCTFEEKASNAQAAGASAVVIFNEGQSGRQALFDGALDESNTIEIPVLSASYEVGMALVEATENPEQTLRVMSDVTFGGQRVENVLVEYPGASGDVWMLGAHLDSVPAGPGINDNGTGVANILETARYLADNSLELAHGVRFAFWAGEELGLLGSIHYIQELSEEDATRILGYLNLDMIGSPNPGRFIYDGDQSSYESAMSVPEGSGSIEQAYEEFFNARGVPHAPTRLDGRSDYYAFMAVGIPSGGLFSGAEDSISMADAELFDLNADYYDACYHRACDGMENLHHQVFTEMSDATTHVTLRLAGHLAQNPPENDSEIPRREPNDRQMRTLPRAAPHGGCHGGDVVR